MQQLVAIYLLLVPLLLGALMLWQHHRGSVPLLSLRNLALVGLCVFQYFSGFLHLWTNDFAGFTVRDPGSASVVYAGTLTAFTVLFLLMYRWGWPLNGLSRIVPIARTVPRDPTLIGLAIVLLGLGTALRFVPIPYIGIIANYFGFGLIAVATGFVGWVIARNYLNPFYYLIGAAIVFPAMIVSVLGTFGRRGLVAVGIGLVWGAFYARLRYLKTHWIALGLIALTVPGLYALAAMTSVRTQGQGTTTAMLLRGLASPNFREAVPSILSGQSCGPAALFVIENYPEYHRGTYLNNFTYFFIIPVPRAIWSDKPETLANEIASKANIRGVNQEGITIPPGVVGYIAAEGGVVALFVYAWFFGVGLRFFDLLVRRAPWSPMVIMPVGSALGQIIGLFRGEMSLFFFIHVTSFVGAYTVCVLVGKVIDRAVSSALPVGDHEADEIEHEFVDQQWSGEDGDARSYDEDSHRHAERWDAAAYAGYGDVDDPAGPRPAPSDRATD